MAVWATLLCAALAAAPALAVEWLDLSHTYDETTQYLPGMHRFNLTQVLRGQQQGFWVELNNFETGEHGGTHMDAPCHLKEGAWTLDQIPPERFIAHAALVDISERSQADPDTTLTVNDLAEWKSKYGTWRYPTILLVHTGNAAHWRNTTRYLGLSEPPPVIDSVLDLGVVHMHFPGLSAEAAQVLADDPAVVGVGLDTPSLDPGTSKVYPAHQILFAQNKFGLEHMADMSRVPPTGATIIALPMKIGGGSGGPCRVMVRLP